IPLGTERRVVANVEERLGRMQWKRRACLRKPNQRARTNDVELVFLWKVFLEKLGKPVGRAAGLL
ncbi:MAG: hypothetical protein ACREN8_10645, partial [Candidatus Dormibacteraceae bacterium]